MGETETLQSAVEEEAGTREARLDVRFAAICIKLGFDFRMRHGYKPTHEIRERLRIAHYVLGRNGGATRHGSLRIVRKQILWLLALGINRFDWL